MDLKDFILGGINFGISNLATPVFTFNGTDYNCVPSVNEFDRKLEEGGFSTGRLLTMVVPLLDSNDNAIFTTLPEPQNIVTYNGEDYRIISTKVHPTGAYIRIIGQNTTRGV